MERTYSTFEVMKAVKIDRERLRPWMEKGFIPVSQLATGQGTRAIFTTRDVYAVALFKRLVDAGLNRKRASALVKDLFKQKSDLSLVDVIYFRTDLTGKTDSLAFKLEFFKMVDLDEGIPMRESLGTDQVVHVPYRFGEKYSKFWGEIYIVNIRMMILKVDRALAETG
jgi:hypothetical protein